MKIKFHINIYLAVGLALLTGVLLTISVARAQTPNCCAPPFTANVVKPNILILLDMTGSMQFRASMILNNGRYDSTRTYYGYFNPTKNYKYASNKFFIDPNGKFPGNMMNFAIMSRIDVARKALTGGKGQPTTSVNKHTLNAEGENLGWDSTTFGWPASLDYTKGGITYRYRITKPGINTVRIARRATSGVGPDTIPSNGTTGRDFTCDINVEGTPDTIGGVIRQIADKDLDRDWDSDAPRFALQFFSTAWGTQVRREFYQSDDDPDMEPFFTEFDNKPQGGTNTGNAVLQSIHYIKYCPPYTGTYFSPSYTHHGFGTKWDPFYRGQGGSLILVPCTKNFVIVIGDGESNSDVPVTADANLPPKIFPARDLCNYDNETEPGYYDYCNGYGDTDHPADDFAYYGHIQDLRPVGSNDSLPDMQNITFYALMTFGLGSNLFQQIGKDGGFIDKDNDNFPDTLEWDRDGNGLPDNYFDAEDGYAIEDAIKKIITDIMARVSSGSGAAVVSTGTKTGGGTVQAQFYPRKSFPTGEQLDWIGTCQSLWLDPFGFIREDNSDPGTLNLLNDYIVTMKWKNGNVRLGRWRDLYGNGDSLVLVDSTSFTIEDLIPVWDAGKYLWNNYNPPTGRSIWTFLGGAKTDFTLANHATIRPALGIGMSLNRADSIIRFIRGEEVAYRSRLANGKPWKLGDVVSSSPAMIGAPIERYDFIYSDLSYSRYYSQYVNRRQVAYVGANDGMLHAFNGGFVEKLTSATTPLRLNPGSGRALGEELWAYIPYNNLPHLRWLLDPSFAECHVYSVDQKPYITDAQIFDSSAVHPGGWATILIGGMRLGGATLANEIDTCRSSFFCIDITDPLNPEPLWEFKHSNLKYTVCYPIVVKVKTKWFLIFGSGPMTCGGDCSQQARIFVLDLRTGNLLRTFILPDNNSFVTNIFGSDWGINYSVDRIYFGDCYGTAPNFYGRIYRILTNENEDPAAWTAPTMVMDLGQHHPITGEGSIATDEFNHLWVYFSSGRFFSDADELNMNRGVSVGFRDDTTHSTLYTDLFNVTNIQVDTTGHVQPGNYAFDSLVRMVDRRLGWYRIFPDNGERNLSTTLVLGGAVLFTTFVPTDSICSYGGRGKLYALYYRTGTAYPQAFLDDTLGYNKISVNLGQGMPSEPALYVNAEQTKVFVQVGGGIVSPETGIPGLPRSGVILWKSR